MMRYPFMFIAGLALLGFLACKKSSSGSSDARTMANMSGTYDLTAISGSVLGQTINLYDSLPACEQDNKIILSANGDAQFKDAGTVCAPPSDSSSTWSLSSKGDSIYLGGEANAIQSFNGKVLVVTTSETVSSFPVTVTTTLTKE
ncbi:MAG TPA: hypothetical protein VG890_06360 [Puia sp.]|nr:hypothetical protein [Puia sp.]